MAAVLRRRKGSARRPRRALEERGGTPKEEPEPGTRNQEPGTRNQEPGTTSVLPRRGKGGAVRRAPSGDPPARRGGAHYPDRHNRERRRIGGLDIEEERLEQPRRRQRSA